MYSSFPTIVLGFHGCDEAIKHSVINSKTRLTPSKNEYDWLGHGIYIWENNPKRALEYAQNMYKYPERYRTAIKTPTVIGAIIDVGKCLNLLDSKFIGILKESHTAYRHICETGDVKLAENKFVENGIPLKRHLDCAVIETLHSMRKKNKLQEFDSARGVFIEGEALYEGAGFKEKSHIQVCVRNPNCIKGYFDPLDEVRGYSIP